MTDIVAELRARRIALGLSQAEVGRRMGVGYAAQRVCDMERGRYRPRIDSLERWVAALDMRLALEGA